MGGRCVIPGRTPCSDTQCNYHNYPSNSFINNYLVVTPRGEEKRERRGGGTARPQKGGGEIPARSGQDRLSPARLRRRRPTKARRRLYKVTPGSGSGADPAWPALEGPEVQIVTLGNSLRGRGASLRTPYHRVQSCLQNSKAGLCVT